MRIFLLFICTVFALSLHAQVAVSGRVLIEAEGEGAIGATVQVKDSQIGTVTDFDGNYTIDVPENSILVFSYTGFIKQEIPVAGQRTIDVVLSENASQLDELVVIGYGSTKRSDISGSVSSVSGEEIAETPILRVEQALQGRSAGVQVAQTSGSPGAPLTVRIRGVGSINNSDPLYIVDGTPVTGLDFLNPSDIASMDILKDAASCAIYGSRGANGVVLITTKGGKFNQPGRISYDAYYGVQRPARLLELLTAEEYATVQNEMYISAGQTPPIEFQNPSAFGQGTDWQEAIFQNAPISSHQLTFTGGSAQSTYTISGNFFNQDGIVGGDKANFKRGTARLNSQHKLKNWLTVGNNLGFTWFKRNSIAENNQFTSPIIRALNIDPITPIRKQDGTFAYSNYADTDIANPVNGIENTYNQWTSNRVVGALYADIKLHKNLSFRTSGSLDATFANSRGFSPIFDLSSVPSLSEAPPAEKNLTNGVGVDDYVYRTWQWENVLSFNKVFNGRHDLGLIAGTTALENRNDGNGSGNTNLPSNNWDDAYIGNTIDPIANQTAFQWATESTLLSYFGRASYVLDDKYLLTATLRADGSSKFGANNRYGYFPSFSGAWKVSREDFWNPSVMNYLKVRASWGQNGNERIGEYSYSTIVNVGQNYAFGPDETITNGSVALSAANPDLRWETSTQADIGLDMEFWQGRIALTTDYYIKKTSDMLYASPIPLVAGSNPPIQNVADAENRGFEIAAEYRNADRAFQYSIGGNIAFVRSEVTSLGRGGDPVLSGNIQSANANAARTDVGQPIASFYGYVTDGIFQTQAEVEAHAFQSEGTQAGDIRFVDLDGNGVVDINDRTYIGNPTPDFAYGFTTNFSYKNTELNLFFQGTHGNDIYNATTRYDFAYVNRPASVLNRWTGPGTSDFEPRVSVSDPNQNARISDRFVEDGSYLRLKTATIAYNLPKSLLSKASIQNLKFYVTAQNLLTFTNYTGFDPEIGNTADENDPNNPARYLQIGIDYGFYPQARTILGGVSVQF